MPKTEVKSACSSSQWFISQFTYTKPCDGIVEWNIDLHGSRHEVLNVLELLEIVFRENVVTIRGNHTGLGV
jgi:hypothetical protein